MANKKSAPALACYVSLFGLLAPTAALAAYIAPGATLAITGPDGVCGNITNPSGTNNMFVSTYSTAQWQSFLANPHAASVGACPCVPNGSTTQVSNSTCCYDIYDSCGSNIGSGCISGCS